MKTILEQIEVNKQAFRSLQERMYNLVMNADEMIFLKDSEIEAKKEMCLSMQKRVLRLRERLYNKLQAETQKELQRISTKQRELNLSNYKQAV